MKTVLTIDDSKAIRDMVSFTLSGAGYRVVEAENGAEGLTKLADAVDEVLDIDPAAIEPLPERGAPWPPSYVTGALRRQCDLALILDTEALFRPDADLPTEP